jgi:UDP-N-acetylmuramoyl-tripeptide--D-alanyl-D-alanine ligase
VADLASLNIGLPEILSILSGISPAVPVGDLPLGKPLLGISTDTRTIKEGELFIALKGGNFDADLYVDEALKKGAAAVVAGPGYLNVSQQGSRGATQLAPGDASKESQGATQLVPGDALKQSQGDPLKGSHGDATNAQRVGQVFIVPDTLAALGELAGYLRRRLDLKVAAVTGSVGKTTVKELLASIFTARFGSERVLYTQGNFNNLVGLPLTLFRATKMTTHAVLELGANEFGEIERLTQISDPDVALITKVAPAHLMNFNDLPGVAKAKGELFRGLRKDAVAVVNVSDRYVKEEARAHRGNIVTFGRPEDDPQYYLKDIIGYRETHDGTKRNMIWVHGPGLPHNGLRVGLKLLGAHSRQNALAAVAAAMAGGVDPESIVRGLEETPPPPGRGVLLEDGESGVFMLDDSYNANPSSMRAAINLARELGFPRVSAIVGAMMELGADAPREHRKLGESLAKLPLNALAIVGEHSEDVRDGAIGGGADKGRIGLFDDPLEAYEFVRGLSLTGDLILVKGSHSTGLSAIAREFSRKNHAL